MLFGPKLNTVFINRWRALIWAGSILLTAYCTVPVLDEISNPKPKPEKVVHHHNPWALDKK